MIPRTFIRNTVSFSLAVCFVACGATGPRLQKDQATGDGWKRDFRMTAGLDSMAKSKSYEDKVQSLDALLAQEMAKTPICPNGYQITKHGVSGVRYWWVEGLCT